MVEFALVCPLIFAIFFGMVELSRVSTIVNTTRSSVLAGAREAIVAETNSANVQAEMERVLTVYGINSSQITITPAQIDGDVTNVSIDIAVPLSSDNGILIGKLANSGTIDYSLDIVRPN